MPPLRVLLFGGLFGGLLGCGGAEAREPENGASGAGDEAPVESDLGSSEGQGDPHATLVIERLNAITVPTLPEWESEVRSVMLSSYDADRSGKLDTDAEVDAVICEVWQAINEGYGERSTGDASVREAYGFAPETFWIDGLGVDRSERERLRVGLLNCGVR